MPKIISELGINHNGSYLLCKKMIDQSSESGCWGVKFQYRNLKRKIEANSSNKEIGLEILDKEISKNYLKPSTIIKLSNYARRLGVKVGISFFQKEDVDDFKNYKFDFYKVPSVEALNFDLIKKLLKKKIFLIVSLGGMHSGSITHLKKELISYLKKSKICFMHCVSNYPLNPVNANIGFIAKLKKIFPNNQIGYSSHESSIINCIIALSKKIDFIERHFTIDKTMKGLDHTSSSDFKEMKELCFYAKNYDLISKNTNYKNLNQGEKINIQNLGKSAYCKTDFVKGDLIKGSEIYFQSPKIGLSQNEVKKYLKFKILKNLPANSPLTYNCFFNKVSFQKKLKKFSNLKNLSLPIRPHDYKKINDIFGIKNYEFHLSFNDIKKFNIASLDKDFLQTKFFTVHGPDYCNENEILDIFSSDKKVNILSKKILNKTITICKYLKKISGNNVYLIQSFSSSNSNDDNNKKYILIKKFINKIYSKHGIKILPQWLPPVAWYFGGSVKMTLFSDPNDLHFLKKINLKICMDLSHFNMSCNYYNVTLYTYFIMFKKLFNHYHLADSSGIDGEGLKLGDGDLMKKNSKLLKLILNLNKVKVLEVWQGHLNDGNLFKNEINKLNKLNEK